MVVGAETLLHEGMMFSVKGPMGKVLEMLAEGFHIPPEIRRLLFYPSFCSGSAGGSEESRGRGGQQEQKMAGLWPWLCLMGRVWDHPSSALGLLLKHQLPLHK